MTSRNANVSAGASDRVAARTAAALGFAAVLLSIWVGGHVYLARALIFDTELPGPIERLAELLVALLGTTLVAQVVAERWLGPRPVRALTWVATLWMGFVFFAFLLLLFSDAVAVVAGIEMTPGGAAARTRAVLVVGATLLVGSLAFRAGWDAPTVQRRELTLRRWPRGLDGFRIVQISDVHIGPLLDRSFARDVAAQVAALKPDLVAVTGDLVDGNLAHLRDEVAPFGELRAPHGVWFVTGNHDYYSGVSDWLAEVRRLGMRTLQNERVVIEAPSGAFELAGVNDRLGSLFGAEHASDLEKALRGWTGERALVLLAHDPTTFHQAWRHGIDLQISGHTHGGQLWPFGYFVHLAVRFVAGHYRRGEAQLWVSSGTGFWGPPMRLGTAPEITELVLRAE
jgi:uncharacterized protein